MLVQMCASVLVYVYNYQIFIVYQTRNIDLGTATVCRLWAALSWDTLFTSLLYNSAHTWHAQSNIHSSICILLLELLISGICMQLRVHIQCIADVLQNWNHNIDRLSLGKTALYSLVWLVQSGLVFTDLATYDYWHLQQRHCQLIHHLTYTQTVDLL